MFLQVPMNQKATLSQHFLVKNMAKTTALLVALLRIVMILVFAGWVSLWILKPTRLWTNKWKEAEDRARPTLLGYYGLDFLVYTFPVIALAIIGFFYLNLLPKEPRIRQARRSMTSFSKPLVVNSLLGVVSAAEILAVSLFVLFLAWTFYTRISNDFKKLVPIKTMKLNLWQLKYLRLATRFGLLSEACLALMLLPILRGMSLFRVLGIQFEASVKYHIWLGTTMVFFATIHGASTLFIWGVSHYIQDEVWKWQKTGRIYLAGEIALVTGLVIWVTSLPQIRRRRFELFYYTHHLYIIFLVFFLFHAGDRHFYMVFPGIFLFGLDKLLRIIQSRPETCILSARAFPCRAVELILSKDPGLKHTPTSVMFMKIPSISKTQWHSFSICSSSNVDDHTMSVIIKCDGWWTDCLYQMINAELSSEDNKMKKCIPVGIEGPYGPATVDFLRYDSLLLIAGGIGITPFLSILQEIGSVQGSSRSYRSPTKVQLVYVVKKCSYICLLDSISPLLLNQSAGKWHLKLSIFVTQEDKITSLTVKELLQNELPRSQTVHFGTKSSSYAVHGPESLPWMAALAGFATLVFLVILICSNHIFVPYEKKAPKSKDGAAASKEKTPSWIADIIIISSFLIAMMCSGLMGVILRWRKLKKEVQEVSQDQAKAKEVGSLETRDGHGLEEHEVHFGGRPNFKDMIGKFGNESGGGSEIGVLVCGPETMKDSVATMLCHQKFKDVANNKKPHFSFHSLNFTL